MPRIFLRVNPAKKFGIRIGVLTKVILRSDLHRIRRQAQCARFLLHPMQRYVRKSPIPITSADVAMGADEPALLQRLMRRGFGIP